MSGTMMAQDRRKMALAAERRLAGDDPLGQSWSSAKQPRTSSPHKPASSPPAQARPSNPLFEPSSNEHGSEVDELTDDELITVGPSIGQPATTSSAANRSNKNKSDQQSGARWSKSDVQLLSFALEDGDIFTMTNDKSVEGWRTVGDFVGRDPLDCLERAINTVNTYTELSKCELPPLIHSATFYRTLLTLIRPPVKAHKAAFISAEGRPAAKASSSKNSQVITIDDSDDDSANDQS